MFGANTKGGTPRHVGSRTWTAWQWQFFRNFRRIGAGLVSNSIERWNLGGNQCMQVCFLYQQDFWVVHWQWSSFSQSSKVSPQAMQPASESERRGFVESFTAVVDGYEAFAAGCHESGKPSRRNDGEDGRGSMDHERELSCRFDSISDPSSLSWSFCCVATVAAWFFHHGGVETSSALYRNKWWTKPRQNLGSKLTKSCAWTCSFRRSQRFPFGIKYLGWKIFWRGYVD